MPRSLIEDHASTPRARDLPFALRKSFPSRETLPFARAATIAVRESIIEVGVRERPSTPAAIVLLPECHSSGHCKFLSLLSAMSRPHRRVTLTFGKRVTGMLKPAIRTAGGVIVPLRAVGRAITWLPTGSKSHGTRSTGANFRRLQYTKGRSDKPWKRIQSEFPASDRAHGALTIARANNPP
jgi:hypothetical protein